VCCRQNTVTCVASGIRALPLAYVRCASALLPRALGKESMSVHPSGVSLSARSAPRCRAAALSRRALSNSWRCLRQRCYGNVLYSRTLALFAPRVRRGSGVFAPFWCLAPCSQRAALPRSWLLADHPMKQFQTIQGSSGVLALPA
jgi:hypothetical protein